MTELVPSGTAELVTASRPLDLVVSDEAIQRVNRGRAESTQRSYDKHWGRFVAWCGQDRTPLPCTAHTFLEYANHLMRQGKAKPTIVAATTAIRDRHKKAGYAKPDMDAVQLALVSYGGDRADERKRKKQASAFSLADLSKMVAACPLDTLQGLRDRTVLVLGTAMMARRSELAALTTADISEDANGLLVYVAQSKTDQGGEGEEVPISYWAHADACPVRLTTAWAMQLADRGITSGPLLRRIDRHGRIGGEPEFAGRNKDMAGFRPDGQAIGVILRRVAQAAGVTSLPNLSAHSLRASGATIARDLGGDPLEITRLGRWVDGSTVALGYFRRVDRWRNHPLTGVKL